MPEKHLMVIDPAVVKPAIESYNRMVFSAPYPVTYHLPALYGLTSIEQMKNKFSYRMCELDIESNPKSTFKF